MELPLVVGVDGSRPSLSAVDWAVDEAARHRRPLRLVHAAQWEPYEGMGTSSSQAMPSRQLGAEHIAAEAVGRARLRNPDVEVWAEVLAEDAETALLREAANAFALVTGSRGRGGLAGLLLGSVSLAVAAYAACPVVVVRGAERNREGGFGRVVLGVSGTGDDRAAVEFAFREAEARGSVLHAVHAWRQSAPVAPDVPVQYGEIPDARRRVAERELADALRAGAEKHSTVQVRAQAVEGLARRALLDAAAEADLLVVGARRRHGASALLGFQLGLVNHAALHHAACPVVLVPGRG